MERRSKLIFDFIRYQYYPHLLIVCVLCLLSGGFFSFQNLALVQSVKIMERYVIFIGILLLVPIVLGEQDRELWQLEQSKKTPMWQLYALRLILAVAVIMTIVTIFLLILQNSHSEVLFEKMWFGSVSELLFLGAIGFFVSAVTNQVVLGYMVSVMYYAANLAGKPYFGKLGLLQMESGNYDFTGWMLCSAIGLIVLGIIIRENGKAFRHIFANINRIHGAGTAKL